MKDNPTKNRIFCLGSYLMENTDEDHTVTSAEIMEYLDRQGFRADRKTVKSDIDLLAQNGFDIIEVPGRPKKYFVGSRLFELPELKLLVDAVSSSRFITQKKSAQLITKLSSLASAPQRETLDRHIYTTGSAKPENENIYYIIDTISDAIRRRRTIEFKYMEYTADRRKVYRGGGEIYTLSPYALYWNEDYYYVVGWSAKHGNVSAFRVDRMDAVKMTDDPAVEAPENFSIANYSGKVFEMFDGDSAVVNLECRNSLMKYVIDRFGEDVITKVRTPETFEVIVEVALSPTFYSWLFRFAGEARILSPERAVMEYHRMAERVLEW